MVSPLLKREAVTVLNAATKRRHGYRGVHILLRRERRTVIRNSPAGCITRLITRALTDPPDLPPSLVG